VESSHAFSTLQLVEPYRDWLPECHTGRACRRSDGWTIERRRFPIWNQRRLSFVNAIHNAIPIACVLQSKVVQLALAV
jgi:hypothetical protein